ncbi:MAG: DUF302 domain-containing protein [Planctomycetes bacterium]|nr:DUF302 domain-containing protein [Planctomycetota bacterium]MBL7007687.1 DUF302 domain-containing protein [Planctomycetota bacterium]
MDHTSTDSVIVTVETSLGIDEAVAALEKAAVSEKFGVVGFHDMNATMAKKGITMERQVRIVEMCQPQIAKEVIGLEPEISAALPCRVSVFERDGKNWLSTIRPTAMLGMFGVEGAEPMALQIEATMLRIMEKARS